MPRPRAQAPGPWTALLALALLAALVLAPTLFGDRALVGMHTGALSPWRGALPAAEVARLQHDSVPLLADKTIQFWPLLDASLNRLSAGHAPLWNDRNLAGVPLLAQGFQGALHPINWLARLLPYARAFGWIAWLQAFMAGAFAWLLARELGCRPRAALLAGSTWMLCGYLTSRWHWYMIQGCSAYLPLALWGMERGFRAARLNPPPEPRPARHATTLTITALAVGLAWLTGWMQGALHLVYLCGAWGLARLLPALRAGGARRAAALASSRRCAVALLLGLCLGSAQLLPTLEWVASGESARDVEPPEVVASLGMSPAGLLGLLSPDNLGHPADLASHPLPALRSDGALRRLVHQRNGNFVESNGFVGVIALVLALIGAGAAARGRGLALGLLLAGLVLCLKSPLLLLVARLPGLASGDPLRFLLLFSLGATLLSALGLDRIAREGPRRGHILLAGLACLLALLVTLWIANLDAGAWTDLLAPGLARKLGVPLDEIRQHAPELAFDRDLAARSLARLTLMLGVATGCLLLARRRRALALSLLLAAALTEQGLAAARNAISVPAEDLFEPPPRAAELAGGGRLLPFHPAGSDDPLGAPFPGNTALPSGIDDLSGYWALAPRRMIDLLESLQPGRSFGLGTVGLERADLLTSPVLSALAVQQVISAEPLTAAGWRDAGRVGDAFLLRRQRPAPAAWFSSGHPADEQDALAELLALREWPARSTPLSPRQDRPAPSQPQLESDRSPPTVALTELQPERWVARVDAPRPGVVVIAHTWSPGWSAQVDGQPAVVWPAWHVLQAVEVPAGKHEVRLTYASLGWRIGSLLASAALALMGLLLLIEWRGRRAIRPSADPGPTDPTGPSGSTKPSDHPQPTAPTGFRTGCT